MTTLWKTQQVSERVRCRYLQPTNGQKQLAPIAELEKTEKPEGDPAGGIAVSINLDQ